MPADIIAIIHIFQDLWFFMYIFLLITINEAVNKDERFISNFRFASWLTPRPEDIGFRFRRQEKK